MIKQLLFTSVSLAAIFTSFNALAFDKHSVQIQFNQSNSACNEIIPGLGPLFIQFDLSRIKNHGVGVPAISYNNIDLNPQSLNSEGISGLYAYISNHQDVSLNGKKVELANIILISRDQGNTWEADLVFADHKSPFHCALIGHGIATS